MRPFLATLVLAYILYVFYIKVLLNGLIYALFLILGYFYIVVL